MVSKNVDTEGVRITSEMKVYDEDYTETGSM